MPKVSAEHVEARKRQILDAATACFARHGVRETTIQKICAEAGLSAGAVYRYFKGKRAILEAVYQRSLVANQQYSERLAGSDDPKATLLGMAAGMVQIIGVPELEREHHLSIRVHAEGLSDPDLARSYTAVQRAVVDQMTPLIEGLQADGEIPGDVDAEYLLWVLITVYQGLRVQYMLDPSLDLDRFGAAITRLFQRQLEPVPKD